jgi:hypothetical protein
MSIYKHYRGEVRKILAKSLIVLIAGIFILACNTVSKEQLQNVKVGDKLIYRHKKDGREWMWAEKITRIEGDKIYYNPGKIEATSKNAPALDDFDSGKEGSHTKEELLKYTDLTGDDQKVIIEIR